MVVYFNGSFLPKEEVRISPDDRGFLFGDGVYEVLHSYNGCPFAADLHWRRLQRSLGEIRLAVPDSFNFTSIVRGLIQRNELSSGHAYIYLQITRGAAPRNHAFPQPAPAPTIYAYAVPFQPHTKKAEDGVKVCLVPDQRWLRCDIKTVALLGNVLASEQARERGVEEAVLVRDGRITEGSKTNFAVIKDGKLISHPRNHFILTGVTLQVVLELCRELNIAVEERPLLETELAHVQEAMLLGTTIEVLPVICINDALVASAQPGPITRRLQQAFRERVAKECGG